MKNHSAKGEAVQTLNAKLDGKLVAQKIKDQLTDKVAKMSSKPGLAVILIGEDPASQVYVGHKVKACKAVGIESFEHRLPADVTQNEVEDLIKTLNSDDQVDGILLQLPVPKSLESEKLIDLISPFKDADGLSALSMGRMLQGKSGVTPCTPTGVIEILDHYEVVIESCKAVVVGRSQIVGLPMAHLLQQRNATVTLCHSRTANLSEELRAADIVVLAAGRPRYFKTSEFKQSAVVVDVGIHRGDDGKLCGDLDVDDLEVAAYTPVPGGVGPMTIAMLLKNTVKLAQDNGKD